MNFFRSFKERNNSMTQLAVILVLTISFFVNGIIDLFENFSSFPTFVVTLFIIAAILWAVYKRTLLAALVIVFFHGTYTTSLVTFIHAIFNGNFGDFNTFISLLVGSIICIYLFILILSYLLTDSVYRARRFDKVIGLTILGSFAFSYIFVNGTFVWAMHLFIPIVAAYYLGAELSVNFLLVASTISIPFALIRNVVNNNLGMYSLLGWVTVVLGILLLGWQLYLLVTNYRKSDDQQVTFFN